jgi:hypothetical protein
MRPRHPLRFALCDDLGAGKTIMAGPNIKELLLRGDLRRCLIVAPGGLVTQWQDEMRDRFDVAFSILTRDMIEASGTADPFAEHDLLIARLDHLSRNDDLVDRLSGTEWDLTVVDEAHRMAAHRFGAEIKETGRYRLGKVLGQVSRHFLLMTATPHAGKDEDFQLFLGLIDPDRFEGRFLRAGLAQTWKEQLDRDFAAGLLFDLRSKRFAVSQQPEQEEGPRPPTVFELTETTTAPIRVGVQDKAVGGQLVQPGPALAAHPGRRSGGRRPRGRRRLT